MKVQKRGTKTRKYLAAKEKKMLRNLMDRDYPELRKSLYSHLAEKELAESMLRGYLQLENKLTLVSHSADIDLRRALVYVLLDVIPEEMKYHNETLAN